MSICVTQGIQISARPYFLPDESEPEHNKFVFAYEITISNHSEESALLVDRHWLITDATNTIEEVRGEGVVGHQPLLEPGETFTYQSYCPLPTNYGFMRGTYGMLRANGERFEATIAPFVLMLPSMLN
jgi:ApaG protein